MASRGKSRSRSGRRVRKKQSRSGSSGEGSGGRFAWENADDSDGNDGGADSRVALLEVENESLKAENRALRKKLMEALKRLKAAGGGSAGGSGSRAQRQEAKEAKSNRAREPSAEPADKRRERVSTHASEDADAAERRRDRLAAAAARHSGDVQQNHGRERETRKEVAATSPKERGRRGKDAPSEDAADDQPNAVLLANFQMEAYNERIPNNIPPEKRLPLCNEKMERFLGHFSEKIQVLDLKSGGPILKDLKIFRMRYMCVFRESGASLKGTCTKRFYFDGKKKPTYVIDFEKHESLVTAQPGTRPDGSLGVRDPRTEHLVVLYEEKDGKLSRMWLRPDADKLGQDPCALEDIIVRSDLFKSFEAKIAELRGGSAGEYLFQNYLEIPTVG